MCLVGVVIRLVPYIVGVVMTGCMYGLGLHGATKTAVILRVIETLRVDIRVS